MSADHIATVREALTTIADLAYDGDYAAIHCERIKSVARAALPVVDALAADLERYKELWEKELARAQKAEGEGFVDKLGRHKAEARGEQLEAVVEECADLADRLYDGGVDATPKRQLRRKLNAALAPSGGGEG